MAIEFECPNCRSRIRTPDEAAGKKARCPHCQQISPVPASSSLEPLGNLGGSTASLPSSQAAWPPANSPAATNPPLNTPVNPFLLPTQPATNPASSQAGSAAAWLPPADAYAPIGSLQSSPGYQHPYPPSAYSQPQPTSTNPFGDQPANYGGGPGNPYQSPASAALHANRPLSPDEMRQMLFGPAVGIAIGALLCIGVTVAFAILIALTPEFQKDAKNDPDAFVMSCIVLSVMAMGSILPSLISLFGAYCMFRGKGLIGAWIGAIAGVMPCSFCFFVTAGFAIWGMVILSDPRVSTGMK